MTTGRERERGEGDEDSRQWGARDADASRAPGNRKKHTGNTHEKGPNNIKLFEPRVFFVELTNTLFQ